MGDALDLVGDEGGSPHVAHVLAQAARRSMLAGDSEEAVVLAGRAIELATAIGAEAPRVNALITRATAKANFADYTRVREDLEEANALALETENARNELGSAGCLFEVAETTIDRANDASVVRVTPIRKDAFDGFGLDQIRQEHPGGVGLHVAYASSGYVGVAQRWGAAALLP